MRRRPPSLLFIRRSRSPKSVRIARTYEPLALYLEVGLVYLLFCTVLTRVQAWGEKLLNRRGAQRS